METLYGVGIGHSLYLVFFGDIISIRGERKKTREAVYLRGRKPGMRYFGEVLTKDALYL